MPEEKQPISPKVHAAATTAAFGGAGAAVLLIWGMQAAGVPAEQFTPERVVALGGLCSWAGGYLGGYYKSA